MTLLDIFKDLSYGELQNTAIGNLMPDDNESQPDPRSYNQILSHLNRALTKIYSRFLLSAKEIYVELHEEIAIYVLESKYAQTNVASLEDPKFIADSAENPFEDDILKIEQCYDELGNVLFLNDDTEELSIFTPSYKSIQVPYPNDWNTVAVQYRAAHPKVEWTINTDANLVEVAVPEALYEAVLYAIAARAVPRFDGGGEGGEFMQKYEMACQAVEKQGLHIQSEVSNWRFDQNGWV